MKGNIKAAIYIRLSKYEQAVLKKKDSKEKEVEKITLSNVEIG